MKNGPWHECYPGTVGIVTHHEKPIHRKSYLEKQQNKNSCSLQNHDSNVLEGLTIVTVE